MNTVMQTPPGELPIVQENIDKYGQHLFGVFGRAGHPQDHPFMYTIGNADKGFPELLVIGAFPCETTAAILNLLGQRMRDTKQVPDGIVDIGGDIPLKARPASDNAKTEYTLQAGQHLRSEDYDVVQLLFCDKTGKFPGDRGVDQNYADHQPLA